ncbi:beta strand repeat-containing protein, partial [Bradyrhizobium sp. HKCCYLS2038]
MAAGQLGVNKYYRDLYAKPPTADEMLQHMALEVDELGERKYTQEQLDALRPKIEEQQAEELYNWQQRTTAREISDGLAYLRKDPVALANELYEKENPYPVPEMGSGYDSQPSLEAQDRYIADKAAWQARHDSEIGKWVAKVQEHRVKTADELTDKMDWDKLSGDDVDRYANLIYQAKSAAKQDVGDTKASTQLSYSTPTGERAQDTSGWKSPATDVGAQPDLPNPDEHLHLYDINSGDYGAVAEPNNDAGLIDINEPADPYFVVTPIVLDLSGQGLNITQLGSSSTYLDVVGDGLQHRTAWAGAGNGALVLDVNNNGVVDNPAEFAFTMWDPTATSDMEALLDIFDSNHDGKLDSSDTDWSLFKVLVTNTDGTTQMRTLAELGISAINLVANNQTITLPDGSVITGSTTFTRTDGSTGTAADVSFAYDANGYVVARTIAHNADGSTTLDDKCFNTDGSLAYEIVTTTSADGRTVTINKDSTGDGVVDSIQTSITIVNADGSRTKTLTNFDGTGSHVLDRTVTTTSADLRTVTIQRDATGSGIVDQIEVDARDAAGNLTVTITNLDPDGSVKSRSVATTSADGLAKTTRIDSTGSGVFDQVTTDNIVVLADGGRIETVSVLNSDGSLRSRTVTQTSADHRAKTVQADNSGNGIFDTITVESIVVNADGSSVTSQSVYDADGSLRQRVVTSLSADGLSKTTQTDSTGNGTFDLTTTDVTVVAADGTRTETVIARNADGSLRSRQISIQSADGRTRSVQTDSRGAGTFDSVETVTPNADGSSIDTLSIYNPDGSLASRSVTTTSADGLSVTTQQDTTGTGVFDQVRTDVVVLNADGSSTETITDRSANGALIDGKVVTTSANGLSVTTQKDTTGAGVYDLTETDVTVRNADGSSVETVTDRNADGSLKAKTVTTVSADRRVVTAQIDAQGDGVNDEIQSRVVNADGSVTTTVTDYAANGALLGKTLTTTSANGLSVTTQKDTTGAVDASGNAVFDQRRTDVVVVNADGSRTETVSDFAANGALKDRTITTTSANGLSVTTQWDRTGTGAIDQSETDLVVLNADGSSTETVTDRSANGALLGRTVTTTSGNGLSVTTQQDTTGTGVFDVTET